MNKTTQKARPPLVVNLSRLAMAVAHKPEASLAVVIVLGAIGGGLFVSSDVLTLGNMTLLMQAMIPQLAMALGVSIALYSGIVDLSIGSTMLLSAMSFAIATHSIDSVAVCVAIGVSVALIVGVLNSILVVTFGVDSIVATLATLLGIQGLAFVISKDLPQVSFAFSWDLFVARQVGAVPVLFIGLTLLYVAASIWMKKARPGRHMMAVGAGPIAAKRLGIRVGRLQCACLVVCAVAAGIGGVLAAGLVGSAPLTLGGQDVFVVYSGILLGGFSLDRGGVGTPMGAFLGVVALSLLVNILSNGSVPPGWQGISIGIMLMIAVATDRLRYGTYSPSTSA